MPATLEPALASVSPKAASFLPAAISGRYCSFCASEADTMMGMVPRPVAAKASEMPPHALDSSSVTSTMFMIGEVPPRPPYFSSM